MIGESSGIDLMLKATAGSGKDCLLWEGKLYIGGIPGWLFVWRTGMRYDTLNGKVI